MRRVLIKAGHIVSMDASVGDLVGVVAPERPDTVRVFRELQ